ncbi:MAG: hypothetical protein J7L37_00030 [Thermococcus sp.]|nr:hypothetical protein [Thermococcus sp.]
MKLFLFLGLLSLFLVSFLISSEENYQLEVEAHFEFPAEFEGAELKAGYPNAVTHVALFKFKPSSEGQRDFRLVKTFDLPAD